MKKLVLLLLALVLILCACGAPAAPRNGQIYLYGEAHADPSCLEKELAAWKDCYAKGMRHLFVEMPCYMAAFYNLWMHSDTDEILDQLYADSAGTLAHGPVVTEFYRAIKRDCPETVFHGTDIGHQFDTTGMRYLRYLEEQGLGDSPEYEQVQETIHQGTVFYRRFASSKSQDVDWVYAYRENCMAQNFAAAYDALDGLDIMGIYGAAHTDPERMDFTGAVPCMARQLLERYGDALHTLDLRG